MREIKFQRPQSNIKDKSSLMLVDEFFQFLQGKCPDEMTISKMPNLSKDQAFSVIYYLQEHLPVFPDTIEKCDKCGKLFDIFYTGNHCDLCGNFCCDNCDECDCDNID